jgi:DnaJ-domain-containing protein 1
MPFDPFTTLGLPPRFDLGPAEVERAYLARVAAAHPDMRAGADDSSADLNRARRELKDPESRASALLSLLGGPAKEDDKSLPPGLLMEMMEAREELAAAVSAGARDDAAAERWESWATARRAAHQAAVAELFAKIAALPPADPAREPILRAVRVELNAWRYVERMLE